MKKITIQAAILIFICVFNINAQWKTLSSGTTSDLYSVYFASPKIGYSVGFGADGGDTLRGIMLKTEDGGVTWKKLSTGKTNYQFSSIYFTSEKTGYAVGGLAETSELIHSGEEGTEGLVKNGIVLKTVNGGATWTALLIGQQFSLMSVFFSDVNTGYVVGEGGTILKTTDGGNTWKNLPSGTKSFLVSVYFANNNTGYAVGEKNITDGTDGFTTRGTILKTTNGGDTWTALTFKKHRKLNAVFFTDSSTGYAVGDSGVILKTMNEGNTWNSIPSGTTYDLTSVNFPGPSKGYVIGNSESNSIEKGIILRTIDKGLTWTVLPNKTTDSILSVYFIEKIGYVVGGYGTILKLED